MPMTLSSIVLLLQNNKLWLTYNQCLILFKQDFFTLKLVLNVEKTKCMWLSNSRNYLHGSVVLRTLQGKLIALVSEYKYLGIIIDDCGAGPRAVGTERGRGREPWEWSEAGGVKGNERHLRHSPVSSPTEELRKG